MQRQRLLSDRQQFQREQMKLLELRSPTTLTPQTPLPLTPSARQFVAPTTKIAPPPTDISKDPPATAAGEEGVANETSTPGGDDKTGNNIPTDMINPLENVASEMQEGSNVDASDVLPAAESVRGAELLPPVTEEMANTNTTTTTTEDLFPIDFPNSDHHHSPSNEDHMISERNEESIQQSVEFESSNQISADIESPDPTAFDDFDNIGQFDQADETNQSDQLDKLAEQLDQLPQQPVAMDDNSQSDVGVHQLELPTDTS